VLGKDVREAVLFATAQDPGKFLELTNDMPIITSLEPPWPASHRQAIVQEK
jgi:hypothetical protein